MTPTKHFDLLETPLVGTNLIEASAGTGKTYTIAGLFVRLVLERHLSVNEILVVTFTEAATGELKHRIRNRLKQAMDVLAGRRSDDAFLNHMAEKWGTSPAALSRLEDALREFDQAAIYTIHGFCSRVLHDNAFEGGRLFDTELVVDQADLKQEVVEDFWRMHTYEATPFFVNYALDNKFSPEDLVALLGDRFTMPYLKVIPSPDIPDTAAQERALADSFDEMRRLWQAARDDIVGILTGHEGLSKVKYRKEKLPALIREMDAYLSSPGHDAHLFKGFEKFFASELNAATRKDYTPPFHPFFELCEQHGQRRQDLVARFEDRLLGLKVRLFHYAEAELAKRKREKNVQFFDDLLLHVYEALNQERGGRLSGPLRGKYRAALIDEFQDTDPVQYTILKKVFGNEEGTLFLIGDPKQSIYGFRGADVFAYMEAASDVATRYTLQENWRSAPELISAINAIFGNAEQPFVYDEIPFQSGTAAAGKDHEGLILDGRLESPFHLWFLDADKLEGPGRAIGKGRARALIARAVAQEISRLIELGRANRALLGQRPLAEGDMAVLVRTNAEARMMQSALRELNISSVLYRAGNLFDSHEALEMERVLACAVDPANERRIKAAICSDMIGINGEDLETLMANEGEWEKWFVKFRRYHDLWTEKGFMGFFRNILSEEGIRPRLMSFPDGERRITNVLHLSEVLHQVGVEKKLGMKELLKWLCEHRQGDTTGKEEYTLRLESDENAVNVVTLHKSKGLEYPIVFCPFTWGGARIKDKKGPVTFHDTARNMTLTLDLGSQEQGENRVKAEKELLAENLRLLYVGLTRAKCRCYLVWGRFNEAETSAPAYLFHQPRSQGQGDIVTAMGKRFRALSSQDMLRDLEPILNKAEGAIQISPMPLSEGHALSPASRQGEVLDCKTFSGKIDDGWRISSFSSLVSSLPHGEEMADRDAMDVITAQDQLDRGEAVADETPLGMFSFPRGTRAGTLLHEILEHLDFAQHDRASAEALVSDRLTRYSFEALWAKPICSMIQTLMNIPLHPELEGLRLSCIGNKDRLNELEFYFPLKMASPGNLRKIFEEDLRHRALNDFPETIERLEFAPTRGFMRGFMDLVFQWRGRFYLVDWKSNFLGDRIEDYGPESLAGEMKRHFYVLQYIIYILALDQYLRLRMPEYEYETHFGGVFYIFLRGLETADGKVFGIYRDVPPPELIQALREELLEGP